MKKKLLSLVLAGAMVATTSVSAFADTNTQEYDISSGTADHRVDIEGNVENLRGETVPGTISVTVPTSVAFTINSNGNITGGKIKIVNKSKEKVEVVAKAFTDTTIEDKIVIVKDSDLDEKIEQGKNDTSKKYISLNIESGSKSLGLISAKGADKTGFLNGDTEIGTSESDKNVSLGTAWKDNDLTLSLTGRTNKTGETYSAPTNPIHFDAESAL